MSIKNARKSRKSPLFEKIILHFRVDSDILRLYNRKSDEKAAILRAFPFQRPFAFG